MMERCSWSDLPTFMCAHCAGNTTTPTVSTVRNFLPAPPTRTTVLAIATRPHVELPRTGRALPEDPADYQLVDHVAALCDWTISAEPHDYEQRHRTGSVTTYRTRHRTISPPLLLQLWQAAGKSRGMDTGSRVFGSSPSAALEALDVANEIDHAVHRILKHDHGEVHSHDRYPSTIAAIRHLGSVASKDEAKTIKRWWSIARVVTGWDLPAFKPNNTCPLCGKRGSLRIKSSGAFCVECRAHWDEKTVPLLGEHIKAENHEDEVGSETA